MKCHTPEHTSLLPPPRGDWAEALKAEWQGRTRGRGPDRVTGKAGGNLVASFVATLSDFIPDDRDRQTHLLGLHKGTRPLPEEELNSIPRKGSQEGRPCAWGPESLSTGSEQPRPAEAVALPQVGSLGNF